MDLCLDEARRQSCPGAEPVAGPDLPGARAGWRWTSASSTPTAARADGQATAQAAPLRVNEAGFAVLPVWVAWKPMSTEAFGAMAPL